MSRGSRTMLCVACGWVLAAALPAAAVAPALAYSPRTVRLGVAPPLPIGARVLGALAPTEKLDVTVALAPRDPAALAAFATAVSTPGSSVYRAYITPREFARRFGPTDAQIAAVEGSLRAHGLNPRPVSTNGLSIHVAASAAALDRAFGVSLARLGLVGRATAVVNRVAPALDAGIAHLVQGVIGLDGLASPRPLFVRPAGRPVRAATAHAHPHVVTGGPQPCTAASAAAPMQSAYTADQIASAYGLSNLYQTGNQGQGQTIALYELEPNDASDIAAFQSCYGTQASISYLPVDGGAGSGPGSGEAALDIEAVLGLAPRARLLVYQAPNSGSNSPGAGPYDEFSAIISQDLAKVVSASWGQCESVEGSSDAAAEGALFQEAAAQGQTIVSATGDTGSEDCYTGGLLAGTELAVDDPASQPFVTGVGGTSLLAPGPRPSETVWNAGGSLLAAMLPTTSGAGGGGISSLWRMPGYQSGAPSSLHVLNGGSTSSGCGPGSGFCRELPDVSADADPSTGYLIYWNGTGAAPGQPTGWQTIGGTSLSAPLWAGLIADVNAAPACAGSPLGFVNPALYRAAASGYASDFNDVQSGSNDFTGTNHVAYAAGSGYDMASGLGTPNASALAGALCAQTLRLVNPGARSSTVNRTVSLQARSTGGGSGVRFEARGLPAGLSINAGSGRISGTPRKIGRSTVTLGASADGALATTSFTWTVGGRPTVSHKSLTGAGRTRPMLRLTLHAGRGAPPIEALAIALPRGITFASGAHGVALPGHVRFTATLVRGILTVIPATSASRVALTVGLAGPVAVGDVERLRLTATDALGNATRVPVRVTASR